MIFSFPPSLSFAYLVRYRTSFHRKAFRRKIPIRSSPFGGQFDVFSFFFHNLRKTEVSQLGFSVWEKNVPWLKIVVDDRMCLWGKIVQCVEHLYHDKLCFAFTERASLFQMCVEIAALMGSMRTNVKTWAKMIVKTNKQQTNKQKEKYIFVDEWMKEWKRKYETYLL